MHKQNVEISTTQNREISALTEDALDAVAGGQMNMFNPLVQAFLHGFASTAPVGNFYVFSCGG